MSTFHKTPFRSGRSFGIRDGGAGTGSLGERVAQRAGRSATGMNLLDPLEPDQFAVLKFVQNTVHPGGQLDVTAGRSGQEEKFALQTLPVWHLVALFVMKTDEGLVHILDLPIQLGNGRSQSMLILGNGRYQESPPVRPFLLNTGRFEKEIQGRFPSGGWV